MWLLSGLLISELTAQAQAEVEDFEGWAEENMLHQGGMLWADCVLAHSSIHPVDFVGVSRS